MPERSEERPAPARTLVFDRLDTTLGEALADGWRDRGGRVVDALAGGGLAPVLAGCTPYGVVLTEPRLDEAACVERARVLPDVADEVDAFAGELYRQTMAFLADCRAAVQAMMPAGQGRVLALCIDDVAARILGLPQTPIANQARAAALKSLAKEYGRMGLGFNTVVCQPPREMVRESAWRANRERLKVYALRYRPIGIRGYVRFLLSMLEGDTPANGGVFCLGNGVMEMTA